MVLVGATRAVFSWKFFVKFIHAVNAPTSADSFHFCTPQREKESEKKINAEDERN